MTAADTGTPIVVVTVHHPDGSSEQRSVTSDALRAQPCPTYDGPPIEQYGPDGYAYSQSFPADVWTIGSVLACLQVDPTAVSRVVVTTDGGREISAGAPLERGQLTTPSQGFENPEEAPVVADEGNGFLYDRPWRGGDDANVTDHSTQNGPLRLDVFEGAALDVAIAAPATVAAGRPMTLTGTVEANTGAVTYAWSFPNSGVADSSAPSPSVTFPAAGTYGVQLFATDAHGGGGGAEATVTVTDASATPTPTPAPTTGTTRTPSGGTNPAPTAPTRGPRNGRHGRPGTGTTPPTTTTTGPRTVPPPTPTRTGSNPRLGHPDRGRSPGPTTSTRVAPTPPAAPPRTTATTPPTTATATTTTSTSTTPTPHRPPVRRQPRPGGGANGAVVDGRLVGAISALPAASSPLARGTAGPALGPAAARRSSVTSPWPAIGGGLAVVALLALGALREQLPERLRRALRLRG